jgi:hypothetical protein
MPAKRLADIPAKCLADRLLALEGTRNIIGLVMPSIAIIMLPKPTNPLDNIKSRNIPAISTVSLYIDRIKLYSILIIGLGTLAKYIYSNLIIITIYSI